MFFGDFHRISRKLTKNSSEYHGKINKITLFYVKIMLFYLAQKNSCFSNFTRNTRQFTKFLDVKLRN